MPSVEIRAVGPACVITLDRPAVRNAMDTEMLGSLLDAVTTATADPAVRVLVLTGAGGAFSGGADLREALDSDGRVRRTDLFGAVYEAVGTCPKPTIAAVSGACVGGGAELAAACDLRVADATAAFRFPGAALGLPVGPAKLTGLVGLGAARDLVLTARTVDAAEALRLGLVQRLAEAGAALEVALDVARVIAAHDDDTVRFVKRMFLGFSGLGDRIAAENDALHALAEADGSYDAITAPNPKAGWAPGTWTRR